MNNKLFVGNLKFDVSEEELKTAFAEAGVVISVSIPTDKYTGKKRGFGFVEMETARDAQSAIDRLNGKSIMGREISVDLARPKAMRP
ncbi:MAG: RNA-binding protein [Candidatus Melainabacteria bacterium]|jgi:cold-inducible RNA-binding protein|nr:RNA-binding protein [Candidatus Melainabacteria bacterium]MBX9674175.1 RNA-binding protein [Candidatus Obscuribacterales bacterium]